MGVLGTAGKLLAGGAKLGAYGIGYAGGAYVGAALEGLGIPKPTFKNSNPSNNSDKSNTQPSDGKKKESKNRDANALILEAIRIRMSSVDDKMTQNTQLLANILEMSSGKQTTSASASSGTSSVLASIISGAVLAIPALLLAWFKGYKEDKENKPNTNKPTDKVEKPVDEPTDTSPLKPEEHSETDSPVKRVAYNSSSDDEIHLDKIEFIAKNITFSAGRIITGNQDSKPLDSAFKQASFSVPTENTITPWLATPKMPFATGSSSSSSSSSSTPDATSTSSSSIPDATSTSSSSTPEKSVIPSDEDMAKKDADWFKKPGHNALGTGYWQGGKTWVGEKGAEAVKYLGKEQTVGLNGPELVNLPRGSQVIPNSGIDRSHRSEELKNPELRNKIMALAVAESGGDDLKSARMLMETGFNRADAHKMSLNDDKAFGKKYYEPMQGNKAKYNEALARLEKEPELKARMETALNDVHLKGTNDANYGTQNSSNAPGNKLADLAAISQTVTAKMPTGDTVSIKNKPEFANNYYAPGVDDKKHGGHGARTIDEETNWEKETRAKVESQKPIDQPMADINSSKDYSMNKTLENWGVSRETTPSQLADQGSDTYPAPTNDGKQEETKTTSKTEKDLASLSDDDYPGRMN